MARNWRESDHPRHPKGRSDGGRFRDDGKPNLPDPDFVKAGKPNPRYAAKKAAPKKAAPAKKAPKKAAPRKAPAKEAPSTKTPARAQTPTTKVASAFHEDWRKTRRQADGSYEPRIKTTKDKAWIRNHGTDQVDIANTSYADLPNDWKKENREAAKVVTDILARNQGAVNLDDKSIREFVGEHIHREWLKRNAWAKGGELDVPFKDLPRGEQEKDIDQLRVAMRVLSGPDMDKLRGAKAAPTAYPDTRSAKEKAVADDLKAARGRLREGTDALTDADLELLYEFGNNEDKRRAAIAAGTREKGGLLTRDEIARIEQNLGKVQPWLQRLSDSAGKGRQRIEISPDLSQPFGLGEDPDDVPLGSGPLPGVGIGLSDADDEPIIDEASAREALSELFGRPYEGDLEGDGEGGWIVTFSEEDANELIANGFYGRENEGGPSLEAEWPSAASDPRLEGPDWATRISGDIGRRTSKIRFDSTSSGGPDDQARADEVERAMERSRGATTSELIDRLYPGISDSERAALVAELESRGVRGGWGGYVASRHPLAPADISPGRRDANAEQFNYMQALLDEARDFARADESEGDESPELRGQIAILEEAIEARDYQAMERAATHLRRMLTISYADEEDLPEVPSSVRYLPGI